MVEWSATEDRVCGYGEEEQVTLEAAGWLPGGDPPALGAYADAIVVGRTRAIRLPTDEAWLPTDDASTDSEEPLAPGSLPTGVHRIAVEAPLAPRLALSGPATVEDGDGEPWIRFPQRRSVAVGFRESPPPRPTVAVSPTPAGLARAVTAAGRTHGTDGPERSHPGFRPRTPRVVFGDRSIPDRLAGEGEATMTVPASTTAVLVAAPLTYYLGATLRVGEGPPRLAGPGLEREFAALPAFAEEAATALRRLCRLDTELRSVPGETAGSAPADLEGAALSSAPPTARLAAAAEWSPDLPEWPLSTYVDDDVGNGRHLPGLLDRLSLVHPAAASELDPKALLERSLEEFYRGETPNVEAVDPALAAGRHHAWLGEGTPVDAYTLLGSGVPSEGFDDELGVDVVCNDPEMRAEEEVAEVYRRQLADRKATVRVHQRLPSAELAAVLERPTTLVHFIGHCEVDGLVCPDRPLAASELDGCRASAFFLNACGSYYEGYDLVSQGATVGAVTLSAVLDEQAVRLGTAFAELLSAGFAFERALSLARGEIIVGRDYAVVGDGARRLRPPRGTPTVIEATPEDDGFALRYDVLAPDSAGRRYVDPLEGLERDHGHPVVTRVDRASLVELLEGVSAPVRYDGDLRWSRALARELSDPEQPE